MGSLLPCGAQTQAHDECRARLQGERDARSADRCSARARAFAAHAEGLSLGRVYGSVRKAQGVSQISGTLVHPDDVAGGGTWKACPGGRCLTARALQTDWRPSADAVDLDAPSRPASVAELVLDLAPVPPRAHLRLRTGAEGAPLRFVAPAADGASLTVRDEPYEWHLGMDLRILSEPPAQRLWWLQFLTDADPARASMLAWDGGGPLRLVPLADPVACLPFRWWNILKRP